MAKKSSINANADLNDYRLKENADLTEVGLSVRAAPLIEAFRGRLPLQKELVDINEHFGVEIAQTVFMAALDRLPTYSSFLRRVRSFDLRRFETPEFREAAGTFEVTIVASQMPLNGRKWGDHTEDWTRWARSLGFKTDVIATKPQNDLWRNAAVISSHLLSNPHPRRILITYGQGATELRSLLTRRLGIRGAPGTGDASATTELDAIKLWVNIAGAYSGASSVRYWKRSFLSRAYLKLRLFFSGRNENVVNQIDSKLNAFRSQPNFPLGMEVINVVAMPFRSQVPLDLGPVFAGLSETGPNDGLVDLYSAIAHPGLIVPIPGMSAQAECYKLEPVFKRVLAAYAEDAFKEKSQKREQQRAPGRDFDLDPSGSLDFELDDPGFELEV